MTISIYQRSLMSLIVQNYYRRQLKLDVTNIYLALSEHMHDCGRRRHIIDNIGHGSLARCKEEKRNKKPQRYFLIPSSFKNMPLHYFNYHPYHKNCAAEFVAVRGIGIIKDPNQMVLNPSSNKSITHDLDVRYFLTIK